MLSILAARGVIDKICRQLSDSKSSGIAEGITTDEYFNLRLTELDLITLYNPKHLDQLGPESSVFGLWQHIKSSGGYPKPKLN